jgi:hypothetical protein
VWIRWWWWWWWATLFANVKQGRGLGAKKVETKHASSILAVLCAMVMESDGGEVMG